LVLVVFFFCLIGKTQTTTTGAIGGVLSDPSGAVVPGAVVTLRNDATNSAQTAKSSGSGSYRFDLIPPGRYTLEVNETGFVKTETRVTVSASQVLAANIKLTIGSDQQTVSVTAEGTLLHAEDGNVATTVTQAQVEEVPNSGNNLTYETKITAGFNTGFGVVGSTLYQIDGENDNDPYNNSNNSGASNLLLGLNDVQEATITANGYSGQFGGLVGATASFLTKSGGNRVHGNASWFWTGRSLVANSFSHKEAGPGHITPRSFENANQWAALISGPVVIPHVFNGLDKLFFLADAEGLRAILPAASVIVAVPSANFEAYTLKTLAANGLSASIPYYQNIFNIYNTAGTAHNAQPGDPNLSGAGPIATGCATLSAADAAGLGVTSAGVGPAGACANSYSSTATTFANEALEIFRVDGVLGAKDKAFIRFEHDSGTQPTTTDPINPAFSSVSVQPEDQGQFNETHIFGTKATNNLILAGFWYGALFGPPNLNATLAVFPAQMSFNDSGFTTLGGSDASFPTGRNITTVQAQDDFAINEGAHTFKVGAKAYYIKENDHYFTASTVPNEVVGDQSAFINGGFDPSTGTTSATTGLTSYKEATSFTQAFPLKPNYPVGIDQWAVYAEDDWKASHSLAITAALRLEHQGNIKCLNNCLSTTATPFFSLNHSISLPYNQAYAFNQRDVLPGLQELEWEPRFGFAYNPPILNGTMVVRGGYGIFYDGLPGSVLDSLAKNPPTKNTFSSITNDHLANTETSNLYKDALALNTAFTAGVTSGGTATSIKASLPTTIQPFFTPPTLYTSQPNFKMYNVQKWNLEIQKSFGKSTVISINYLGNHGTHKPTANGGVNAFSGGATGYTVLGLPGGTPVAGSTPLPVDPKFGIVNYYQSEGSNNYNGVIVTATQKFGQGGVITAGYTYGKILDTGAGGFLTASSTATGTTDVTYPVDPYNIGRQYGPAATDERHNLVLDYVYRLPFHNPFYGGWEVSGAAYAYSGLPFTVVDTATSTAISGYANGSYGDSLEPTYLGGKEATCGYGKQVCLQGTKSATPQFSTSIYGPSATGAAKLTTSVDTNNPRNSWRGPMYISTDLNVTKIIPLHWEGGRFEASAQAFNVLNHLNFARPTGSLSSGSFGQVTATLNPSGIFSGVGGDDSPRILQLKAKIVF
jgi:hypothetical protein